MNEESVSIIIPAYNVGEYLEECVRSLLCQTYTNYEVLIIDDGSTDNTYDIGKHLTVESEKVKLIHQENQGVSIARNVGIQKANGEFFIFVDADDIVAPQYIETLVECVKKTDMGMVGFTSEMGNIETIVSMNTVDICASDMLENILCGTSYDGYLWNKIFQRKIIENNNLKFEKNIVVWEDLLFVLQYLKNCNKITISNKKLYYYRYREGSAVNNTRLEKYRSKYEVMEKIKKQNFVHTKQSQEKISFLFFETMFSYLNQILIRENKSNKLDEILSRVDIVELLKQRNIKLFLKYVYFKARNSIYKKPGIPIRIQTKRQNNR